MAQSVFAWLSTEVATQADLAEIVVRGAIRKVLKEFGLDPESLTKEQAGVVIKQPSLAHELERMGVKSASRILAAVASKLLMTPFAGGGGASPDEVFSRWGKR